MKTKEMMETMKAVAAAAILTACAALIAAAVSGTLCSCEHKELGIPAAEGAQVSVRFDWSGATGAQVSGIALWLFPEEGGKPIPYDFDNPQGGTVTVPWGRYRALYINNDTETILMRGTEKYATFELYTRPSRLLEPLNLPGTLPEGANPAGDPVVLAPEAVWGGSRTDIDLQPGAETYTLVLPVYPRVCTYSFELKGIKNLKYASAVSAAFSGTAGSLFLGGDKPAEGRSMVPFPAASDGKETVTGRTFVFGASTGTDTSRALTLVFILADGSKHYYRFDVSDRVNNAPDKRNVHILLEGLTLPKPIVNGGGFHPDVDEWETENEELKM